MTTEPTIQEMLAVLHPVAARFRDSDQEIIERLHRGESAESVERDFMVHKPGAILRRVARLYRRVTEKTVYQAQNGSHLVSLGYSEEKARKVVADLLQGKAPTCPRCGIRLEICAASEPWSTEHLICPQCHGTWNDALELSLEERVREALAEPTEPTTIAEFKRRTDRLNRGE
jgi:Zn-finger nucleic acid-binding protein